MFENLQNSFNGMFDKVAPHCDEMDRLSEFKKEFETVNTYDSPLV